MKGKKIILIIFLIAILISLIAYSSIENNNKNSPTNIDILENYPDYNNTELIFNAKIKVIDKTNQTIKANIGDPPYYLITIKTDNIDSSLREGDIIFVNGILNGKNHVIAEKIFIKNNWNDYLMIINSILAIPFALYLFFRTWKFNRKTLTFQQRRKNA
jgi:hypothetical protein